MNKWMIWGEKLFFWKHPYQLMVVELSCYFAWPFVPCFSKFAEKWCFPKNQLYGKLVLRGPVLWDSNRGAPKNPNPFHFRGYLRESNPPGPKAPIYHELNILWSIRKTLGGSIFFVVLVGIWEDINKF